MKTLRNLGKRFLLAAAALALASCAHLGDPHRPPHPLAGKIWDVAGQRFVEPAELIGRAAGSRFVLLGEIHDNEEHHQIQATVLDAVVRSGRRPAVLMEQYDVDQQEKINAAVQTNTRKEDMLRDLGTLMRASWNWPLYQPIVGAALQHRLPLIASNLSREAVREVSRKGYGALGQNEETRLAFDAAWSPDRQQQLEKEIAAGHCGKIPDHMLQAVARAQRARDAVMADKLLLARRAGAIAIVGRGHARQDMGVPLYLAARAPDDKVLSVGLVEVYEPTDPRAYAYTPLGQNHDYLWFTGRPKRASNPCDSIPAQKG